MGVCRQFVGSADPRLRAPQRSRTAIAVLIPKYKPLIAPEYTSLQARPPDNHCGRNERELVSRIVCLYYSFEDYDSKIAATRT